MKNEKIAKTEYVAPQDECELSDDELDSAAGGLNLGKEPGIGYTEKIMLPKPHSCPSCKGAYAYKSSTARGIYYKCSACGTEFTLNMFGGSQVGGNNMI